VPTLKVTELATTFHCKCRKFRSPDFLKANAIAIQFCSSLLLMCWSNSREANYRGSRGRLRRELKQKSIKENK
jgi:hypothetical protein